MTAVEFNHVAVYGDDLDELVRFYSDVFGLERIQAPNFSVPVAWLRCGDKQLHIVERETEPPQYHHFALAVDDFEAVYDQARERDLFDEKLVAPDELPLFELPQGAVQLYLRDPAGNLVEASWPDASTLDADIRERVTAVSDEYPQSDAQSRATLFLDE